MISNVRLATVALFLMAVLLIAGCSPASTFQALSMGGSMSDGDMAAEDMAAEDSESMEGDADTADASAEMTVPGDGATATISTRSLRVRGEPNAEAEVVYGVSEGEVYGVLSLSDDGQWVQLALPEAESGSGWVSSNFVTVSGALEGSTGDALILEPTPVPADETMAEETVDDAMVETEDEAMEGEMAEEMEESMDGEAMGPPPAPEAGYATVYTDGTRLRVRSEPDTESEIVGYVYNGEIYEVVGASDDGAWLNLGGVADSDNPDGGWVSIAYLVPGQ